MIFTLPIRLSLLCSIVIKQGAPLLLLGANA